MNDRISGPLLCVCIPTFNRAELLRRCLQSVLPQIGQRTVEVVAIDNASTDHTPAVIQEFKAKFPSFRSFRNDVNLGYSGNQAKCFEYTQGQYTAILCDDDLYRHDAIEIILGILQKDAFSFVGINYFGFGDTIEDLKIAAVAPEKDVLATNAYEIWNHPSVGHYSGLLFNTQLARQAVLEITNRAPLSSYERFRGIFGEVAIRIIKSSNLPAYFIGTPIVGAGKNPNIDYTSLHHLCLDYYEIYLRFFHDGLITAKELEPRQGHVIGWLPKSLLRDGGFLSSTEMVDVTLRLTTWFHDNPDFQKKCVPLLRALRFASFRWCLRIGVRLYIAARDRSLAIFRASEKPRRRG